VATEGEQVAAGELLRSAPLPNEAAAPWPVPILSGSRSLRSAIRPLRQVRLEVKQRPLRSLIDLKQLNRPKVSNKL